MSDAGPIVVLADSMIRSTAKLTPGDVFTPEKTMAKSPPTRSAISWLSSTASVWMF